MRNALWVIVATVSWGCWAACTKVASVHTSPLLVQLTCLYAYSAFAPVAYLAMKAGGVGFDWNTLGVLWSVACAVLATVAGYAFLFALRGRPATEVVAWTQLYPLVTFVLCWLFLGEAFTAWKAIGCALIVVGAVLVNR